ncbi:hypothetical protein DXG01_000901 [Tephrocybe rancida]|nr:hypothetical protein DXG01_000901 [Tephrocybe rancida]
MTQQNNTDRSVGSNNPITVAQIVAALRELGVTLSNNFGDGTVPFQITSMASGGLPPTSTLAALVAAPVVAAPVVAAPVVAAPVVAAPVAAPATAPIVAAPYAPPSTPVEDDDDDENSPYLAYQLALTEWSALLGTPRPQPPPGYAAYVAATAGNHTAYAGTSEITASKAPAEEEAPAAGPSQPAQPCNQGCPNCCPHVGGTNTIAGTLTSSAANAWYIVTVGRSVGVFRGWHNVRGLVSGVSKSHAQRFPTYEDAVAAFEEARAAGLVSVRR